jgi:protease I
MARIAFIVDDMFEDSELRVPYDRLREAGHEVILVGLQQGKRIEGKQKKEKLTVERAAKDVRADDFDALVVPGGYSPDRLRTSLDMVRLTRDMFLAGKPVAAVCHGPWMLIEADVVEDRTVTSWPSIRTDLINAGARWVDREVVEDGNLITSRKPDDLPAFCRAILRRLRRAAEARRPSAEESARETDVLTLFSALGGANGRRPASCAAAAEFARAARRRVGASHMELLLVRHAIAARTSARGARRTRAGA